MLLAIYRSNDVEMVFRYPSFQRKEFMLKDSLPACEGSPISSPIVSLDF
jgi:hypothetical protein